MSEAKPIERDLISGASKLYIFFGGIGGQIAMPPFEFFKAAKIIDENKIFVRDLRQSWYQDGLPGISADIYSTARFLEKEIQDLNPEKVFFIGNSMGGYAAILFATLIGHGEAIAFAPQTFISPFKRLIHSDKRWSKHIRNTYNRSLFKKKIWDLKALLAKSNFNPKISIFVSKYNRLDRIHADYLREFKNIRIYEFDEGGHEIVRFLRDSGKLPAILLGTYVYSGEEESLVPPA